MAFTRETIYNNIYTGSADQTSIFNLGRSVIYKPEE